MAAIACSVVLHWTGDHRVPGSNTPGAPFETLDFVRDLLLFLVPLSSMSPDAVARDLSKPIANE